MTQVDRPTLAAAFTEWARRYEEDPTAFDDIGEATSYGEACADYLIDLLAATR